MATPDTTAGDVMTAARALLNDQQMQQYTDAVQLPYVNIALQTMQEQYERNNVPVTATVSAVLEVPSGTSEISFPPDPVVPNTPYLPEDMIEPIYLWEAPSGIEQYVPMTKVNALPRWIAGQEYQNFIYYTWQSNKIRFFPCNQDNDIKMDYIKNLFVPVTDEDDVLGVINCKNYLAFKIAEHIARFVEENEPRANSLGGQAQLTLDTLFGISSKGKQAIATRRRPFRQAYKRNGLIIR